MPGRNADTKDPEEVSSGSFNDDLDGITDDATEGEDDATEGEDDATEGEDDAEDEDKVSADLGKSRVSSSSDYLVLRDALIATLRKPQEEKQAAAAIQQNFDKQQNKSRAEIERLKIENQGRTDYFHLRIKWSWFLLVTLSVMVLFQIFLTVAIGLAWFDFKNYKSFLELLVGETFLQIAGMCYIVVRCLFPNNKETKKPEE